KSVPSSSRARPPEIPTSIPAPAPQNSQTASSRRKAAASIRPVRGTRLPSLARRPRPVFLATPTQSNTPAESEGPTSGSLETTARTQAKSSATPFQAPPRVALAPIPAPAATPAQNRERSPQSRRAQSIRPQTNTTQAADSYSYALET